MAEIVGIRFKKVGKVYHFDPCGLKTDVGQHVIVETARGVEYGEVAFANREQADDQIAKPLKKIIRIATPSDAKVVETNAKRASEAFEICERKIAEHHLDMKLVSVEYTFDLNKVLFYFTADGRVDFRDLVKDLASVFRTRIELRQIGVRDEAKVLGGLGICGRPLCCSSFLDEFQPVSINMAKEQNLSLNPTKISGTCGRLMCCLKYEHEVYTELSKVTPRPESVVQTPMGTGVVIDSSILRGTCAVHLDEDSDEIHTFKCSECHVTKASRKGRRSTDVATRAAAAAALSAKEMLEQSEYSDIDDTFSMSDIDEEMQPSAPAPHRDKEKPAKRHSDSRSKRRRSAEDDSSDGMYEGFVKNQPRERRQRPPRSSKPRSQEHGKRSDYGDKQNRKRRSKHKPAKKSGSQGSDIE